MWIGKCQPPPTQLYPSPSGFLMILQRAKIELWSGETWSVLAPSRKPEKTAFLLVLLCLVSCHFFPPENYLENLYFHCPQHFHMGVPTGVPPPPPPAPFALFLPFLVPTSRYGTLPYFLSFPILPPPSPLPWLSPLAPLPFVPESPGSELTRLRMRAPTSAVHAKIMMCGDVKPVVLWAFVFLTSTSAHRLQVFSYFGRVDQNGSPVDVSSPDFRLRVKTVHNASLEHTAFLRAHPSLISNGDQVTVSWTDVEHPNPLDFIALYCPPNGNFSSYLDYKFVNESSPEFAEGRGSFRVVLLNMRTPCQFRYYAYDGRRAELIASSNEVSFTGGSAAPLQGHLALTGKPSQMRVMWTSGSREYCIPAYLPDSEKKNPEENARFFSRRTGNDFGSASVWNYPGKKWSPSLDSGDLISGSSFSHFLGVFLQNSFLIF